MTLAYANQVLPWRYAPPYDCYNLAEGDLAELMAGAYYALFEGERLVGYCCYGASARIPGGDYAPGDYFDMGLGMAPALTGGGRGTAFVRAVLQFGRASHPGCTPRLTVALWNGRARHVYEKLGFRAVGEVVNRQGTRFAVMTAL